jgi:hypothetical protein
VFQKELCIGISNAQGKEFSSTQPISVVFRGVGYMDVLEALLPYRNATNIFLQIKKKCFILQNIN